MSLHPVLKLLSIGKRTINYLLMVENLLAILSNETNNYGYYIFSLQLNMNNKRDFFILSSSSLSSSLRQNSKKVTASIHCLYKRESAKYTDYGSPAIVLTNTLKNWPMFIINTLTNWSFELEKTA